MLRLVMQARRTLYWIRVRRWSRGRGNIISVGKEAGFVDVVCGFGGEECCVEDLESESGFQITNGSLGVDFASSAFRRPEIESVISLMN